MWNISKNLGGEFIIFVLLGIKALEIKDYLKT